MQQELQEQQQQQQHRPTPTSLPLPLRSPHPPQQPLLSPLPPHERRSSERPTTPMDHQYHHPHPSAGRNSMRSSPEYFGHHHHQRHHDDFRDHHHREHWDQRDPRENHRDYRDHPRDHADHYWSHNNNRGSKLSPSEGVAINKRNGDSGSQQQQPPTRYPPSSNRPSSPLHYDRRRSPSFDETMPPRKRHHGTWNHASDGGGGGGSTAAAQPIGDTRVRTSTQLSHSDTYQHSNNLGNNSKLTKKRFKNTLAARRSRAKKVMILEQERLRATELESVNKSLLIRVAVLEAEQTQWLMLKEAQALRIARLEAYLE
ncbi:hypothetical protein BGX29_006966 [Mortierella sp. GBA35]|nr:hypothetical protein BGX29_006966 [Mortierella sp. GBA35]